MSLIMLQLVPASRSTARSDSADKGVRLFVFNCGVFVFQSLLNRGIDDNETTERLISATGRAPGHQVLYLELAEFGPLILFGDLYHFRISREQCRVPMFNAHKGLTLTAMDKVEALVASKGATF
jgi:hypothetical protein